jgi:hypothetical protein
VGVAQRLGPQHNETPHILENVRNRLVRRMCAARRVLDAHNLLGVQ